MLAWERSRISKAEPTAHDNILTNLLTHLSLKIESEEHFELARSCLGPTSIADKTPTAVYILK